MPVTMKIKKNKNKNGAWDNIRKKGDVFWRLKVESDQADKAYI